MKTMRVKILVHPNDTRNKERIVDINEVDHYQAFRIIDNMSDGDLLANGVIRLTPLALDGAIAPDNQQVLPADVLVGEGTLPEPPRQ